MLTIGQVASRAGLRASAIRYYEAQGLLPAALRHAGKRVYDDSILDRLAMIALAAGRRPPRLQVPYGAARAAAALRLLNRHEIALARLPMWFSSEKAKRELGYFAGPGRRRRPAGGRRGPRTVSWPIERSANQ